MKKFMSVILTLCMILSLLPAVSGGAAAASTAMSGTCGDNLTWTLDENGQLTISGTGKMTDYQYNGSPFYDRSDIKTVVISSGVTSIGETAFYSCSGLTSVTIPTSVTSIGLEAFDWCSSLTSVTIPSGVTSIGVPAFVGYGESHIWYQAFYGCRSLTKIAVDSGNNNYSSVDGVLFNKAKTILMQYPAGKQDSRYSIPSGVTGIWYGAFGVCSSLTSVTIPSGVTSIGHYAFTGCRSLKSVTIPSGVTSIGEHTFENCYSLTSVTIPSGVTSIGDYAFDWCRSLTSVTIPSGVTSIGIYAFRDCGSLTSAYFQGNAPASFGYAVFDACASDFTIYYPAGASGWTTPKWNGYKTVALNGHDTIPKSITLTPLDFGEIVVNGAGCGVAHFLVKDGSGNPVPGARFSYAYGGGSSSAVVADGNGIISVMTPGVTRSSTGDADETKSFSVVFSSTDGSSVSGATQTISVKIQKLSYKTEWNGAFGMDGEISLGPSAGASVGAAKAEADAAKGSLTGKYAGGLKVSNVFCGGTRAIDLECSYDRGLGAKAETGVDASAFNDNVDFTLAKASASARADYQRALGIHIDNYDPTNSSQQQQIGKFATLCALLPYSNSLYASSLLKKINWGANAYTSKVTVTLEAGADVGSVKLKDGGEKTLADGALAGVGADNVYSFSDENKLYANETTIRKKAVTDVNASLGKLSFGDNKRDTVGTTEKLSLGDYILTGGSSNTWEVYATTDSNTNAVKNYGYKAYQSNEKDLLWTTESTDIFSLIEYRDEAARNMASQNADLKDLAAGNFFAGGETQSQIEAMKQTGQQATVTETEKHKQGFDATIPIGFSLGVGGQIKFGFTGEKNYSFDTMTGTIYQNTGYTNSASNVDSATIKQEQESMNDFFANPLKAAGSWIAEKFHDVCASVSTGVQNAYAGITGTVSDWFGSVKSVISNAGASLSEADETENTAAVDSAAPAASAEPVAESQELFALMGTGEETTGGVAMTIGEPYSVELYTDSTKQTVVSDDDLTRNPVTITLSYTDKMLKAANATADMDIRIFRYDPDLNLYVCQMNSKQDKSAKTVTAQITKQGEYILAVDTAAPLISGFTTSDKTAKPTITVNVNDMSGVQSLTLSVDDSALVTKDNFAEYYDAKHGVLTVPVSTALADGSHTASLTAADTLGNATAQPVSFAFETKTLTAAITDVTVPEKVTSADGFTISAKTSDDSAFNNLQIVLTADDGTTAAYPMTLANGVWTGKVTGFSGSGTAQVGVLGADLNGNTVSSASKSVAVDVPKTETGVTLGTPTVLAADSGFTMVTEIKYAGKAPMSGLLTAAAYDANGKMLCLGQIGAGLADGDDKNVSLQMNADLNKVKTVKVFLLDCSSGDMPICGSAVYTAK